jgi:hypothetical protein
MFVHFLIMELEGLLTNLRCSILSNNSLLKETSPELLSFQSGITLAMFYNEYIVQSY